MRRHLPRLLLTGALLSPVTLYALGLGEIRLNSALNQPFDADIELISPTAEELAGLKVGLASNELFSRYGIDRPAYLSNFDFSISRSRDGRATIKVRSNRSVTEPFVTLLVEASWARGRLLREYTVLLDPPVFMPSQSETPAPVATPQSGARTEGRIERQPAPQTEPQPEPAAEPALQTQTSEEPAAPVAAATPATIGGEYTVERNDTLWRIASRTNPGSPSGVNQTMIALFRANPDAFNGNINRLRAGSVLRIPDMAEIEVVSAGEATTEVARQTAEWAGAAPGESIDETKRLRLVTPEETPAAPTAATPAAAERATASPTGSASGAPAQGDKRLEVTSPELAVAQQNVDETPAEPAPVEAEPSADAPAAAQTPTPAAEEPVRQTRPAPQPAPEPAGPTLGERIGQFWWVPVVLGLLVVLGLVGAFVRRRRESESAGSLDSLGSIGNFEPQVRTAPASTRRDRADAFLLEGDAADAVADDFEAPAPVATRQTEPARTRPVESLEPVVASKTADDTLSSETAVRFDQQDALAEADFHMAYGLYDQAADLVKIAIDREPSRRDLKLKLLEIYFVWGNKDLFLDTARELHAGRNQAAAGEWDKVVIMGKQIAPEDAMFKGEASATMDLVDVNLEGGENRVDVDLFAEPEGDAPAGLDLEFASGEHKSPSQDAAGSDLDFLLDEGKGGSDEESTRELDPLARTQETPTIESPVLNRSSATIREKADKAVFARASAEQTAELSLDDLGLDVNALDNSGSLEDTTSLESDTGEKEVGQLRDDEMTQLAPSLRSFERTMQSPSLDQFDVESTGTIYIDQVDLSGGGDTVEQRRPDVDATATMKTPRKLDLDLDHLAGADARDAQSTVRQARAGHTEDDQFSSDVFADRTAESPRIDLDVGDALSAEDHAPTNKQITAEMELSELEPVTMSEVGTKLDLARAYMDMGDPDGARSILDEVLAEGAPNQKQEAQRLLESIR